MVTHPAARHAEDVFRAIESGEAARSPLVASWRRSCHLHGLDPATRAAPRRLMSAEMAEARARLGGLLAIAQPNLDRLFGAVGGAGCSVMLADRDGLVVDRRGATADDPTFEDWGLWTGTLWSETHEGTNGIGTCLVEQRTLTIHRDQHFLSRNAGMSCTTAPVFDAGGALVAALDVSSCRADLTEAFVDLIAMAVTETARRIEAENFRQTFAAARIVLVPAPERAGPALVAVDRDDLLVGATRAARLALGISPEMLAAPVPARDLLAGAAEPDGLASAERASLQRALARARGNATAAARGLGISRATLYRKMREFGLRRED